MQPTLVASRRLLVAFSLLLVAGVARAQGPALAPPADVERDNFAGRLEFDGTSDYSHVRVRLQGNLRSMLFVRDSGEEAIESRVHIKQPHVLQFEYLKHLFTSYLFREKQTNVLIVGLGGGGMIHFLRRADPGVQIDAVEIDPLVVQLADKYFGVRNSEKVNIITADGLKYIEEPQDTRAYDVIYIDAFLKPSASTDATGVPLALRTRQFYDAMKRRLKPGGVVAFNINPHAAVREDIQAIAAAFPQAYEFALPRGQGTVVIASTEPERLNLTELMTRAGRLEGRFDGLLHFKEMARRLRK